MIKTLALNINSFFAKGHKRTVNIKKNIIASLFFKVGSILITFLLLPLTINYVEPTKYGIWLTLSSIIAWFGFFDIGFGNGLRNKFAEAMTKGEHQLAKIYVSTTYAILILIMGILLVLFFAINPFLNWANILNAPANMAGELSKLALIVFVFFCLQFVLQLITTITTANQQPAKASLFNFFGGFFSLVAVFLLTKLTAGNLLYLGISLSLIPVLVLAVATWWLFKEEYRPYFPSFKYVKLDYARDLMSLGLKFFVIQIAVVVLYQSNNMVIAQLFGPAQVTSYNVVYRYFSIIPMVLGIIIIPFWSAFTEAWVNKDLDWIKNMINSLLKIWGLLSIAAIVMLLISDFVYQIWVGNQIQMPSGISLAMAAYVIINGWNGIFSQFLNGVGKIKLQFYSAIWGAVLNIPMAIYLGKKIGTPGVILSSVLLGAINMVWGVIQYNKIINNKAKGIWAK